MQRRRPSFFSLPALLLMGVLFALVLYVLFPRQAIFEDLRYLNNPDAVSLAYLETLLKSDPDNTPLRINLGRMQRQAGQLDQARATLAPLMQAEPIPSRAMESYLELLISQFHAAPEGDRQEALKRELSQTLQHLMAEDYSVERKLALAEPALPLLDAPDQLAIRQTLFAGAKGAERLALAGKLARQYEAMGQPARAVDILESVLTQVPGERREAFVTDLIRLELAAGRPGRALALFRSRLGQAAMSPDQLREGIRLAGLAGADNIRRAWLGALATSEPGNLEVQRQWLGAQLGAGDTEGALATLRRMQQHTARLPLQDQALAAQILEWNGKPAEALTYWRQVYRATGSDQAFERAIQLASELFRWNQLAAILDNARKRQDLAAQGYTQLADTLVRLGRLDEAESRLREGLSRNRADLPLRERLATLLVNRRRFPEAIALLESGPALSDRERLQLARLYWRIRDPESAFNVLAVEPGDPALASEAAAMRLELASILGRTDFLQGEYRRLASLPPEQLEAGVQEQLLNLAVMFDDLPGALRLARQRLDDTGNARYLAAIAEYQFALNDWGALASALDQWRAKAPEASRDPRFWTLKALLHQHRSEDEAAAAAFETAATLAPENTDVLISWSWFLLAHPDQLPGHLPQLLGRLAANPSPDSYSVLAYGYQALGDRKRALAWLGRGRPTHAADADWLLAMARLAEQNGALAEGLALRRQSVALAGQPPGQSKQSVLFPGPATTGELSGPLYRYDNRALQIGMANQDLGGFSVQSQSVRGQFSHDRFRWLFNVETLDARGQGLLRTRPDPGRDVRLQLQNNTANTLLTFSLGQLSRYGDSRTTASAGITSQPNDRFSLSAGAILNERAFDSAEAWWLANRDAFYTDLRYRPFPRLELAGRLEHLAFDSNTGASLGNGLGFDATGTYTLFREDPGWQLSLGYRRQSLSLAETLDADTASALAASATPGSLLADNYERIGIETRWYHGEPHALYRTTAEPRFFVGLGAGYVLSTSSPDFGVDLGVGWRVVGDDDLAFSLGYTSDGLDGSARTDLNLTYTLYFGR